MEGLTEKVLGIIRGNFPNGIRNDFIDISKVLRIYSANYPDEDISPYSVTQIILGHGIENKGRFYFINESELDEIKSLFNKIIKKYSAIYYSAVYDRHHDLFNRVHIFSPEVLKNVLRTSLNNYFYSEDFCSPKKTVRLDDEVKKFFAANRLVSLADLQENFPYVSPDKLLKIVSDTKMYLPTMNDKFILQNKIQFDSEEIAEAEKQIALCITENGYATNDDYSLSSTFALNSEIRPKDIRNLVYEKFLAPKFSKRAGKLFAKGNNASATNLSPVKALRESIADKNEVSANQIFALANKLRINQTITLGGISCELTRVSKDLFIKNSLITFDVDAVDAALTPFVRGKIIPLQAVNSFTGFPPVVGGYPWNLFLLEEFLRKHSRKYKFIAPAFNGNNIGAIYPASMNFCDYNELQAAAVVQEKIPLNMVAVENFLINNGFRLKKIAKVTENIISLANKLFK
ncbi:MAG: hypothetical protein K6G55_06830 [Selenomonadaceae bacterium]|nr:hypothetical protein [Selenomonadaceae bacterium]